MAPSRHSRKSRRISRKSPVELADYDWQGAASLQLLHGGSDVDSGSTPHVPPPSPSTCTTTSSGSPPSIVTHLPFAPGSSHTRNRKEGHIPRPPNAFMVFRSWLWHKDNLKSQVKDNRHVSRIAGSFWNTLSEEERAPFRCMAEEAKARHAQLYPDYRYSPGSQKKPKASQRRLQSATDLESEKCKRLADLLVGGIASRELPKYLDDEHRKIEVQGQDTFLDAEQMSSGSHSAAPRIALKRPRTESPSQSKHKNAKATPVPLISTPPSQYGVSPPIFSVAEGSSEVMQTPIVLRTPELAYPSDDMPEFEFVPTAEIPYLSLDGCSDLMLESHDPMICPSHLRPGACSVFSGVKPEATSFVDSCMLGTHTADLMALASPVPFTEFDAESHQSLVPLGSPVFTNLNPFEPGSIPTTKFSVLFDTLDQLFGQTISPLTPIFPSEF